MNDSKPSATRQRVLAAILASVMIAAAAVWYLSLEQSRVVPVSMGPVEHQLGDHLGQWLVAHGKGCQVVVLEVDWQPLHLRRLSAEFFAGLTTACKGGIEFRSIRAKGPDDVANAWKQAAAACTANTILVSRFGLPAGCQPPTTYRHLVLVGESDGTGLPLVELPDAHLVRSRPSPLALDEQASQTLFDLHFTVTDTPSRSKP